MRKKQKTKVSPDKSGRPPGKTAVGAGSDPSEDEIIVKVVDIHIHGYDVVVVSNNLKGPMKSNHSMNVSSGDRAFLIARMGLKAGDKISSKYLCESKNKPLLMDKSMTKSDLRVHALAVEFLLRGK